MFLLFFVLSFLTLSRFFFFFNDTATTEIYTLSLHDALPIYLPPAELAGLQATLRLFGFVPDSLDLRESFADVLTERSEEHTSELQSLAYLVCRLLLEKKKLMLIVSLSFLTLSRWLTTD